MVKKTAMAQEDSGQAESQVTSPVDSPAPSITGFSAARSSQAGDICVMLAAGHLPTALQQHLDQLQRLLGGHPPDLIHVTLQRFEIPSARAGVNLVNLLHHGPYSGSGAHHQKVNYQSSLHQELLFDAEPYFGSEPHVGSEGNVRSGIDLMRPGSAGPAPFLIRADGFLPVHSDFRKLHLLKWRVPGTPELARAYQWVDELGLQVGAKPIYARQTADAMVTALLDIASERSNADLAQILIPQPLFLGSLLVTSRIMGPNHFEILGESSL